MSRRLPSGAKWITLPSGARRVELVLDVGEDPATGQRRQIRRRFKTVEEAIEAQAEILKQAREGSYVSRANLTIEQACADWLAGRRFVRARWPTMRTRSSRCAARTARNRCSR